MTHVRTSRKLSGPNPAQLRFGPLIASTALLSGPPGATTGARAAGTRRHPRRAAPAGAGTPCAPLDRRGSAPYALPTT
ncbi:hypothetical protein [Streptomyces roseolus]|uniref:hypothetical protein n=1 Tax=Streptomyces roseolus TaxID=67358 RepID=UPI0016722FD5|nr:hypothetical protein [Streptomyces roseolus]GGR40099.1 hypothetical protein GCM10010282_36040 [Streptomyces roseolus]